MSKKGSSGGLSEEQRREIQHGLLSLSPNLNEPEVKKIFKAVEGAWASSFFQAFMSTTVIFGGIGLAVFFAFGVSTNSGIHWAIKELSDNVADVCSVITIAYLAYTYTMILYGLSLARQIMNFPFLDPLKLTTLFQKASNMPNFSIYAVLAMLAVLAPVTAAAFFFAGGSHSFQDLLKNYFDEVCCTRCFQIVQHKHVILSQVADCCSILTCATILAFNLAQKLLITALDPKDAMFKDLHEEMEQKGQSVTSFEQAQSLGDTMLLKLAARIRSKAVVRFITVVLLFLSVAGTSAYFLTPSNLSAQLGFAGSLKEYLDEVADLASIFFFSCYISNLMLVKFFVDLLYQVKNATRDTKLDFSPLERVVSKGQFFTPVLISIVLVLLSLGFSFVVFKEQSAVNFFKNSLDEVADVCSILKVGLSIFFSLRVKKFVDLLSGMATALTMTTALSEFDADSPRRGHKAKFM